MAKYGAKGAFFAPFASEKPDEVATALPKYATAFSVGELNKVTDAINFNESSLAGDDRISLYEKSFKDGTVGVESVYVSTANAATILGCAHDEENGLSHGTSDKPPYGGFGFYTRHVKSDGSYFQAVFYPMIKAAPTAETYDTKGDTLTFVTDKLSFALKEPKCGKYKIIKDFDTEEDAIDYIAGLFAGTETAPGLTSVSTQ